MRTSRTFARAALATPLLMLALVACGSDEADSDSDAADPSDAATSESAEPAAEEISADEFAALLEADRSVAQRFTMTIEGGGESISMSGETTPDDDGGMALYISADMGGESFATIIVDGYTYNTFGGDEWLKAETDPETASDSDAQAMVTEFTEGLETLSLVGSEELDGETVQHYTGEVDADGESQVLDFYIDADGHLTYLSADSPEGTLMMDFFDFGADDIIIEAPPADQIVEF